VFPAAVAKVFEGFVRSTLTRAGKAASECRTLAAIRDALLPKLISGEILVKDPEAFLEKATS
jgi:type I restriction enzyme S subunit